jgi:hypothetical protein
VASTYPSRVQVQEVSCAAGGERKRWLRGDDDDEEEEEEEEEEGAIPLLDSPVAHVHTVIIPSPALPLPPLLSLTCPCNQRTNTLSPRRYACHHPYHLTHHCIPSQTPSLHSSGCFPIKSLAYGQSAECWDACQSVTAAKFGVGRPPCRSGRFWNFAW